MAQADLIRRLADGEFHSGEVLAGELGVSRTAVWKQLAHLEALGITLESVRGRGYRIPGGLDLLDAAAVQAALPAEAAALVAGLDIVDSVDSTNAALLREAPGPVGRGRICAAERQLAGRGRRGRSWASPFARNLYVSVGWTFAQGAAALEGLSLAVGVALAEALEELGLAGVALKWPNDLLAGDAKLGGVLIELSGDADGPCRVVVGMGLNVRMPAAASTIDQPWTDLATLAGGTAPSRSRLLAAVLGRVLPLLAGYGSAGFAPWQARWEALDAFAGAPVQVLSGETRLAGVARGVDERGALLLETATGLRPIHGGEVSLRRQP
ncbi:bifunctional biotin--[acetyl-CoA-carboxylase] ligase/biotin operon repressor BirA [Pseudohaliea rubra]|uniref:Bifunctional ligase/repressor BirA n=1 Tax=Pseudohaliea rubra DSM 19751 TaxID=1265313 RepID=A0A095VP70_9GAMM|nr:bifunctional biotin--[acetyl-CoA-carboxylase] ligase/biotin operon repressor BirA [Pseudohaliea rubra]KGE02918.1 Biotin-protein ligase/ Biotin operon repressor [Pseudohaliea rubra DSM 19751]